MANEQVAALIAALVPKFLARCEEEAQELVAAAAARDFKEIRTLGHRFGGVGGSYGFPEITEIGRAIERAGHADDIEAVNTHTTALLTRLAEIRSSLK